MGVPTISVAMPAYQAERWIGETLESVLAQSSAPDEVVVVDDGSTDRTAEIAGSFGERVRVVQQPNGGASAAYNRAFREARCDFVAMCPADDLWERDKLERQRATLSAHPQVDVAFGGARFFGLEDRDYPPPSASGLLDRERFCREMYGSDVIAAPTAVVRRSLYERLGGFREDLACEDYEFWMRALRDGAVFFYDDHLLARLRQHGGNLSAQALAMREMNHQIHTEYAGDVDRELARATLAEDLRGIGRSRLGLGDVEGAHAAYRESLSHARHPAARAWTALLGIPLTHAPLRRLAARRRAASGA